MKRLPVFLLAFVLAIGFSITAHAYVPEGSYSMDVDLSEYGLAGYVASQEILDNYNVMYYTTGSRSYMYMTEKFEPLLFLNNSYTLSFVPVSDQEYKAFVWEIFPHDEPWTFEMTSNNYGMSISGLAADDILYSNFDIISSTGDVIHSSDVVKETPETEPLESIPDDDPVEVPDESTPIVFDIQETNNILGIIQSQLWIILVVGLLYFVYKFFRIFF